ncbi:MAG TPA: response regulator transcription factor [Solirubrobacterales bacterium]|nr:response regulator transcription factor [Solirubrobacterales bacterium]
MRIVVAEDQALMREGLVLLLEQDGAEVVGRAADAPDLLRKVGAHRPDLVVADIRMPPRNADDGLQAALRIRAEHPETAVLLLSQHVQRSYAAELVEQGTVGVGYLLKHRVADVASFLADVHRVAAGGCVLDPEVVATMMARPRRDDLLDQLTPRQLEVLSLMAEGRSNGAIAEQLTLTTKAVGRHVTHIYETLCLEPADEDHRRVLAVVRYLSR